MKKARPQYVVCSRIKDTNLSRSAFWTRMRRNQSLTIGGCLIRRNNGY